jgi:hypothetical protein
MHQIAGVGCSDLDETPGCVRTLPILMKQLQAVRHTGDFLMSAVERASSTSKGGALAAFSVMLRLPPSPIRL